MAIQTMVIDPNATDDQTGDEIVAAINAGAAAITRADSLSQDDLKLVLSNPASGEFHVKNVQRNASGMLEVDYDDVPVA